jgi:hypothetical protein
LNDPSAAGVNALCSDEQEPLAAHRSDSCLNDLPGAALDSVHEFQTAYLSEDTAPPPKLRGKKQRKKDLLNRAGSFVFWLVDINSQYFPFFLEGVFY